jgi:hypothetical protein
MGCGDDEPLPPFEHQDFYETLQGASAGFTWDATEWLDDYGDAAFYGLAYNAWVSAATGDASATAFSEAAFEYARWVVTTADLMNGDVNEIAMAALGLIDYMAATGDLTALAELEAVLDMIDTSVEVLGWYLDGGVVSGYAVDTYGPTSISGLVGLLNLQYAYLLNGADQAIRLAWAAEMADEIDAEAWNGEYYEFGEGRTGMFLYPNITMILHNVRLHQLTGEARFRQRALAVYRAIEALKITDDGPGLLRYRSPYSAEHMGAQTDDYTTLSSQNYTLFALLLLYEMTGDVKYMKAFNGIVEFLSTRLWATWCRSHVHLRPCAPACSAGDVCVDGRCLPESCQEGVIHHWMDGQPASPTDPEYFCSGCNWQLLYVLWYRQHRIE